LILLRIALAFLFDLLYVAILEYALLWILLLIPMLMDKNFKKRAFIIIFCMIFLALSIFFANNHEALVALPFIYSPIASPLIQLAIEKKEKVQK
jgi:hypothetical protein